MIPRGADAVVMVEDTDVVDESRELRVEGSESLNSQLSTLNLFITRAVSPGDNITFAGTDIAKGETVRYTPEVPTYRISGFIDRETGKREIARYISRNISMLPRNRKRLSTNEV